MNKILNFIKKEWLLLLRDKIALAILFIMPMFFVLVISLLQSNTSHSANSSMSILLYSQDSGSIIKDIKKSFSEKTEYKIILANQIFPSLKLAQQAVTEGRYHILVEVPKDFSKDFEKFSKQMLTNTLDGTVQKPKLKLYLDPALNPAVKNVVAQSLAQFLLKTQLSIAKQVTAGILGVKPNTSIQNQQFLEIINPLSQVLKPNPIQQNVPAWSIFGMFFIVIPLAGIVIKERDLKINQRLAISATSKFTIICSRLMAFSVINLLQLFCMFLVGIFILPLFGLAHLQLTNISLILLISILTAIAATSFGLAIGYFAKTYEQASALGPLLVVLFAAIGGIMIPTYLMPSSLHHFSHWSPLNWAQAAFLDVFVRGSSIQAVYGNLIKLLAFSVICLSFVYWKISRQNHK